MYGRLVKVGRETAVVGFKVAFTGAASAHPRQFSRNLFGCLAQFESDIIRVSIEVIPTLLPCRNSQNNLSYPEEPLPMKTTTKRQLVAHGHYSSIAKCRRKIPTIFRWMFGILRGTSEDVRIYSTFLAEPLPMLRGTLVGKQWSIILPIYHFARRTMMMKQVKGH